MTELRRTITIDATGLAPGRLASRIALILLGKNATHHPKHSVAPVSVFVKHCAKLSIRQSKLEQKRYYRTSGHPGGLRYDTMQKVFMKDPCEVLRRAIYGMLPANTLRPKRMLRLTLER